MAEDGHDLQDAIAFISTYPPRQCGIATFTADLVSAVRRWTGGRLRTVVIAVDEPEQELRYPEEVKFVLNQNDPADYVRAAEFLNYNRVRAVSVQHEFGIFGGRDGAYLLDMLRELRCPIVTTFHTVLKEPTETQRQVMSELVVLSSLLVVMSERAVQFLKDVYGAPQQKVRLIHHGVPEIPLVEPDGYKGQFEMEGRELVLTFGLLGPGKGIEYALQALPPVVERYPNLCYIVLGATHPNIVREQGESYRIGLQRLARNLGLQKNVLFSDRFVDRAELCEFLKATDFYLTPYVNQEQITSGTLAYAVGAGKPTISTPYWYAEELLAEGRGEVVPFRDPEAIAGALLGLLDNPARVRDMRASAYEFSRRMTWPEVGRQYLEAFRTAISTARVRASMPDVSMRHVLPITGLPRSRLDHLIRLTDDTGLLQHACYSIPDRSHGYCTDDNARGLVVTAKYYDLFRAPEAERLLGTYLAFVSYAQRDDGLFHNFMSYDRRFLDEVGSDDCFGRALWGLGYTMYCGPAPCVNLAQQVFERAMKNVGPLNLRGRAYAMLGLYYYLQRYPEAEVVRGRGHLRQRRHPAVPVPRLRGDGQEALPSDRQGERGFHPGHLRPRRSLQPGRQRRLAHPRRRAGRVRPATDRRLRAGGGLQGCLPAHRPEALPALNAHGVRLVPRRQRRGRLPLRLQDRRLPRRPDSRGCQPERGGREHPLLPACIADAD